MSGPAAKPQPGGSGANPAALPVTDGGDLHQCPICKQRSLSAHCPSKTCNWLQCRNKKCAATLDGSKGIGHHLSLTGERDPESKMTKRIRVRWNRMLGVWRDRDSAR